MESGEERPAKKKSVTNTVDKGLDEEEVEVVDLAQDDAHSHSSSQSERSSQSQDSDEN